MKSLEIFYLVEGDSHPDIASTFITLGYLFQDLDLLFEAIECFVKAYEMFISIFG